MGRTGFFPHLYPQGRCWSWCWLPAWLGLRSAPWLHPNTKRLGERARQEPQHPGRATPPAPPPTPSPGTTRTRPSVAAVPGPLPVQSKGREQNWKVLEELWGGEGHCGPVGKQNLFS